MTMTTMDNNTKKRLVQFTFIRFFFLILGTFITQNPHINPSLNVKNSIDSLLTDSKYTLTHLREGYFLSKVHSTTISSNTIPAIPSGKITNSQPKSNYSNIYQPNHLPFFHLPPLVLAVCHPLLDYVSSTKLQDFLLSSIMIIVDLGTAIMLYHLLTNVIHYQALFHYSNTHDNDNHNHDADQTSTTKILLEQQIEEKMNPRIKPTKLWIHGLNHIQQHHATTPSSSYSSVQDIIYMHVDDIPSYICLLFYCNPLSIVSTASLQSIWYFLLVMTLKEATITPSTTTTTTNSDGQKKQLNNIPRIMFYISLLVYVELYHVVLVIPCLLLVYYFYNHEWMNTNTTTTTTNAANSSSSIVKDRETNQCRHTLTKIMIEGILFFFLWTVSIHYLSYSLVVLIPDDAGFFKSNYASVLQQSYGCMYNYINMGPNIGQQWYFFVQVFDRYHHFFAVMFEALPYLIYIPVLIRLHRYPMEVISIMNLFYSLFKAVPTIIDLYFSILLMSSCPRSVVRMNYNQSLFALITLPIPMVLYVLDHIMFLQTGSGNANYIYFQSIVYYVFAGSILFNFVLVSMKRDKALRLTIKELEKEANVSR